MPPIRKRATKESTDAKKSASLEEKIRVMEQEIRQSGKRAEENKAVMVQILELSKQMTSTQPIVPIQTFPDENLNAVNLKLSRKVSYWKLSI